MNDDLIRRADAIKVVMEEIENETFYDIPSKIRAIPFVQPKQGEWLKCKDGTLYCSECGNTAPYKEDYYGYVTEAPRYDFCPNCGADMRNYSEKPNNCGEQTERSE